MIENMQIPCSVEVWGGPISPAASVSVIWGILRTAFVFGVSISLGLFGVCDNTLSLTGSLVGVVDHGWLDFF